MDVVHDEASSPILSNYEFQAAVRTLRIRLPQEDTITIRNRRISSIGIEGGSIINARLINCWIGTLRISRRCRLELERTFIGELAVDAQVVRWSMTGGGLLEINFSPASDLFGLVRLRRVYLPRHALEFDANPQLYRDARARLLELNNVLAAAVFHSAELALDRPQEGWLSRRINWAYEFFADYGNSIARPFLWACMLVLIATALATAFDATIPVHTLDHDGWHRLLAEASWRGNAMRGGIYALSAVINPFNIFRAEPLVIARSLSWAFGLGFLGALSTLCLGLVVIGIQRRFKL